MVNAIDNTKINPKTKKYISNSDSIERAVYPSDDQGGASATSGLSTIKAEQAAIIKKINLDPNHIRNININYPAMPGNHALLTHSLTHSFTYSLDYQGISAVAVSSIFLAVK